MVEAKNFQGHVQDWTLVSERANISCLILDVTNTYDLMQVHISHLRHQYIISHSVICSVVGG